MCVLGAWTKALLIKVRSKNVDKNKNSSINNKLQKLLMKNYIASDQRIGEAMILILIM
jgi:hypothetical protein